MRTNAANFLKNTANECPIRQKFEILTVLGAVFPHFFPDKREIWQGGACQLSRLSGQCVASVGRKTHFWTTE